MKESISDFFKMALLFVVVLVFVCFTMDEVYMTCVDFFSRTSVYDLFRGSEIYFIQFMFVILAVVMLMSAMIGYFKNLIRYVFTEKNESGQISREEELKRKRRLSNQFVVIIVYAVLAWVLSLLTCCIGLFLRY